MNYLNVYICWNRSLICYCVEGNIFNGQETSTSLGTPSQQASLSLEPCPSVCTKLTSSQQKFHSSKQSNRVIWNSYRMITYFNFLFFVLKARTSPIAFLSKSLHILNHVYDWRKAQFAGICMKDMACESERTAGISLLVSTNLFLSCIYVHTCTCTCLHVNLSRAYREKPRFCNAPIILS